MIIKSPPPLMRCPKLVQADCDKLNADDEDWTYSVKNYENGLATIEIADEEGVIIGEL